MHLQDKGASQIQETPFPQGRISLSGSVNQRSPAANVTTVCLACSDFRAFEDRSES